MKRFLLAIAFLYIFNNGYGQIGGDNTFEFLNLTPSAHAAALGGNAIATPGTDLSLVWQNPALLNRSMNRQLQLSFADYFEKINSGQVGYASDIRDVGTLGATFHFVNYGSFQMTDDAANDLGTFNAGEYALALTFSKPLDSLFSLGAVLKGIYSDFSEWSASGIAVDLGGVYLSKDRFFSMALVAKNLGRQTSYYSDFGQEPLPFEMQIGFTKRLPKAPFRFGMTWQHLEKFAIAYTDPALPTIDPLTGEANDNSLSFGKKCIRHVVLNAEILLSKAISIRLGYNFQRRAELANQNKRGTVGISSGFGIKLSRFRFDYARAAYHLEGATNQFTIGMSLAGSNSR